MTDYPDDLVDRVSSNRDAYNNLLQTQIGLDSELDNARISYEVAHNDRNFGERIGGWAVKLVKKTTPILQTMWDAEDDIERLDGLLKSNSGDKDALSAETDGAISGYLAGTAKLFQDYLAGRAIAAQAIGEGESYLRLVSLVKEDVDYLSWMVWRDWPYMRDPWRRRRRHGPPRRCPPPRRWSERMSSLEAEELSFGIRGNGEVGIVGTIADGGKIDLMNDDYTGDDGMGAMDDNVSILGAGIGLVDDDDDSSGSGSDDGGDRKVDVGFGLYDPKIPDFSEEPGQRFPRRPSPPRRHPSRPCPPRRRYWHGYWLRRSWALQGAQDGVNRVKDMKHYYVTAMEQYASNRSKHLNELPVEWHTSLSTVNASSVDDLPWYSALSALPFVLTMDRVSAQLSPILENVRRVKTILNSDLSQLESKIAGEVSRVKSEILSD